MLAAAPMQEQKQMLGERLFPLIQVARAQDKDVSWNCSLMASFSASTRTSPERSPECCSRSTTLSFFTCLRTRPACRERFKPLSVLELVKLFLGTMSYFLQGGGGGDGVAGSPGEDRGRQEVGAGGGGQQEGAWARESFKTLFLILHCCGKEHIWYVLQYCLCETSTYEPNTGKYLCSPFYRMCSALRQHNCISIQALSIYLSS